MESNEKEDVCYPQPTTLADRTRIANDFVKRFRYELLTERDGPRRPVTVAGPSCDSVDTLFTVEPLPDLEVGDRVYVLNAGAYTLSYASSFNGFEPPAVKLIG